VVNPKQNFFWPSFTDLMTSLFFIMLVLYVLTYLLLKQEQKKLEQIVEVQKNKLAIIETVEENLKPLERDSTLFRYEEKYKRFSLAFDVQFNLAGVRIPADLQNPMETEKKIDEAGRKLDEVITNLSLAKKNNPKLKNVSYLMIISGYASNLPGDMEHIEYDRSYERAWYLWSYWKYHAHNFENNIYNGLIDLQIAGNGWGGVGRFSNNDLNMEKKNQRFVIQIIPKIGETK
jgi:hypothetical protein